LSAEEISTIYNNYMEKMGSYYNVRKYVAAAPTYELGTEELLGGLSLCIITVVDIIVLRELRELLHLIVSKRNEKRGLT